LVYSGSCCTLITAENGELCHRETPWGAKILKVVKIICNAFLLHRLAERDEIWHNEGHWGVADLKPFFELWTFRQRISSTLLGARRNFAALGVWPINTRIYRLNLINFDSGVPRYHAANCVSPSLIHLYKSR